MRVANNPASIGRVPEVNAGQNGSRSEGVNLGDVRDL